MSPHPFLVALGPAAPDVEGSRAVPDASALPAAVRAAGVSRWLLLGAEAYVVPAAVEVLSGRAPVFGLAGLVVLVEEGAGRGSDAAAALDVPTLWTTLEALGRTVPTFWAEHAGLGPETPVDVARLLASDRVSARTRGIHARRVLADDPRRVPAVLDVPALATLRAVARRTVPQDGDPTSWIDLAARVDAQLGAGEGDGWRVAGMPPDVDAYRAALAELTGFADLDEAAQDAALGEVVAGERPTTGALSPAQLATWFEDARVDLVRQWVAHPATMSRIGFDGFAGGGDGERKQGFAELTLASREDWEPVMAGRVAEGAREADRR